MDSESVPIVWNFQIRFSDREVVTHARAGRRQFSMRFAHASFVGHPLDV